VTSYCASSSAGCDAATAGLESSVVAVVILAVGVAVPATELEMVAHRVS